jgi:hypothetical protein
MGTVSHTSHSCLRVAPAGATATPMTPGSSRVQTMYGAVFLRST